MEVWEKKIERKNDWNEVEESELETENEKREKEDDSWWREE